MPPVPPVPTAGLGVRIPTPDGLCEPEAKLALRQALDAAQRAGEVEVYPAGHGWCPPDARAHDPVQAERAWQRLLVLLRGALH